MPKFLNMTWALVFVKKYREIIVILLFSLTPLLWLRGGEIILGHDATFRLNHAAHMISSMFSWNDKIYYGNDWTYDRGYLPISLVQLVLLKLSPSFSAMQTLFFIFIFLMLGLSMYICVREIFPEPKYRTFRILSSLFAMYNFFVLQGWFTADTGRFLIFSGLPLYLLVIHKLFIGTWSFSRAIVIFAILSFFFNGNGLPPLAGFIAIAIAIMGIYYALIKIHQTGWRGFWFSLGTAMAMFIVFVAINSYWILPVLNYTSASYTESVSSSGGPEGVLAWEHMISQYASFTNLFRLQGIADWYNNINHAYSAPYINNVFLILLSFIPIVIVLGGLVSGVAGRLPKDRRQFLTGMLLLILFGLFMSAGTHPPLGKIYELFIRYIPGFVIFRSSLYKFAFALWVPMIILFGYYINELLVSLHNRKVIATLCTGLAVIWIIGFHYPYLFPDKIFHFISPFTTRIKLPSYVTDMTSYIDSTIPVSARVLLMPELDREYIGIPVDAYSWGYYSLSLLPNLISDRSFIADKAFDNIVQLIYQSVYAGDSLTFSRLVKKAGISYILFRRDVALSPGAAAQHPIKEVEKDIKTLTSIILVKSIGNWDLYKITDSTSIPAITSIQSFDFLSSPAYNSPYLLARPGITDSQALIRTFAGSMKTTLLPLSVDHISEAECFLCKKDEYQELVKSIILPKPSTIPEFIRKSDVRDTAMLAATIGQPRQRIDADLAISESRLAKLVRTPNENLRQQYLSTIRDALDSYAKLSGRDKNYYAIRISAYLESQDGLDSDSKSFLSDAIQNLKGDAWMTNDVTKPRFGFTVDHDGVYTFYVPDSALYETTMLIDGRFVSSRQPMPIAKGFHTAQLTRTNIDYSIFNGPPALFLIEHISNHTLTTPSISSIKVNPTQYLVHVKGATGPYILELNQHYDPRWQSSVAGSDRHVEINSYANGWYIDKTGDYDVVLSYGPQKIFYTGMIISGIAIAVEMVALAVIIRRKI